MPSEENADCALGQTGEVSFVTKTIDAAEVMSGTTIGSFALLQRIGQGGMGEVWLAEQMQPLRRRVAIKLIKIGMDTRELVARFESERQALAMMEHPAIAKIYDAGSTPQGRPYFAMEYVAGIPITAYCDQNKLSTQARLELFMLVCDGVQHAHQKAVIHRDLKPSNILVSEVNGRPMPRIIDFGLAKAMSQGLTAEPLVTRVGMMIGTPGYLSPEQADSTGLDIDTRTDVYSLGVVLYELLVGAPPLDFHKLAFAEIVRRLREEDAPRPSAKLRSLGEKTTITAQNRSADINSLTRILRGDLDAITLKALEKDRARRYQTASEFAADIGRYLRHEPIVARPANVGYRARKYVRRHRVGVAISGAVLALLIGGSITQAFQLQRIRRERDRANRITDFMTRMFRVPDPTRSRGGNVTAREVLDRASNEIDRELVSDPELQGRMMDIIGTVYANLGIPSRAAELEAKAVYRLTRVLGPEHPDTLLARMHHAEAISKRRPKDAEAAERDILEIQRRKLGPENIATLRTTVDLAQDIAAEGRDGEGEKLFRETLATQRRVLGPEHKETLYCMGSLASVLLDEGRYTEAEHLRREMLEIQTRSLGPDHPDTIGSMADLGLALERQGRFADAEKTFAGALAANRRVMGSESESTLIMMNNLAMPMQSQGHLADAEKLYRETLDIRRRVQGLEHPLTLSSAHNLAGLLIQEGKYSEAQQLELQTREIRNRVLGPDHPDTASSTYNLSCLAAHLGHREEALSLLGEAINHGLAPWADLGIEKDPDLNSLHSDPRFAALVKRAKERAEATRRQR